MRSVPQGVVVAAPTEHGRRGADMSAHDPREPGRIGVWAVLSHHPFLPVPFMVTSSRWSKQFCFVLEERCPLGLSLAS